MGNQNNDVVFQLTLKNAEVMASSQDDPNYDSDSQTPTLLLPIDVKEEEESVEAVEKTIEESPVVLQPVEVARPLGRPRRNSDLTRLLEPIIREYFEHGDSSEVLEEIEDIG